MLLCWCLNMQQNLETSSKTIGEDLYGFAPFFEIQPTGANVSEHSRVLSSWTLPVLFYTNWRWVKHRKKFKSSAWSESLEVGMKSCTKRDEKSCKLGVKCILVAFKGGKLERRDHSVCRRRGKDEICLPQRPCLWKRDMEGTCSERRGPNMTNTRAEPKNFPKYLTPTGGKLKYSRGKRVDTMKRRIVQMWG